MDSSSDVETTTVAKQDRGEADDIAVRLEILRLWRQMARSDLVIDALLRVGGGQMDITAQRCAVFCLRDEVVCKYPPSTSWVQQTMKRIVSKAEDDRMEIDDDLIELQCALMIAPCATSEWWYRTFSYKRKGEAHYGADVTLRTTSSISKGGTGCAVWEAGLVLAELAVAHPERFAERSCLELGCGTGLSGILISRQRPKRLVLTDGNSETLDNLRFNLAVNAVAVDTADAAVLCSHFNWEVEPDSIALEILADVDVVVAADILYDPCTIRGLVRTLEFFLHDGAASREAVIVTAIRQEATLLGFVEAVQKSGIAICDSTAELLPERSCFDLCEPISSLRERVRIHRLYSSARVS